MQSSPQAITDACPPKQQVAPAFGLAGVPCSAAQHTSGQSSKQAPPERLGRWGQGLARTQQLLGKQLAQVGPLLTSNLHKGHSGLVLFMVMWVAWAGPLLTSHPYKGL